MTDFFNLNDSWKAVLSGELTADYFAVLQQKIEQEYRTHTVYPPRESVFNALNLVDFSAVRVCILGQDPYHGSGQANGMAFAVGAGVKFPPSLVNIFSELKNDLGVPLPSLGTLDGWAKQGVLLLNTTLTVREGQPQSHFGLGWERLTDAIIRALSQRPSPLVFILWGANAIAKKPLIAGHHHIIASPHPSPLSAHRGFFGSKPFSRANDFLKQNSLAAIDWSQVSGAGAEYYKNSDNITVL